MLLYDWDSILHDVQQDMEQPAAVATEAVPIEFGRTDPQRRQAPLPRRHDPRAQIIAVAVVALGIVCMGVGYGQVVLWAERLARS